jgi:ATP-dependent RNA helicase DeaD
VNEQKKGFETLNLHENILKAISKLGYEKPTPIQEKAIPIIQKGQDLIALAQTGSGKTATCTIPVCNRVNTETTDIQALIIVPTRELAMQYATEAQKIGKYHGVKAFAMFGGEDSSLQEAKLSAGVHVLIATPGRLIDFIYSNRIDLSHVETLILDEADEMLSMGFYDDLEFIIQCLIHEHQTLLFSATMPPTIRRLAAQHMKDHLEISLISEKASPSNIKHQFVYCRPHEKEKKLVEIMKELNPKQSLIFANSRRQCEELQRSLRNQYKSVDFLHGGLSQNIRTVVTNKYRQKKLKHLVATDVAARGLDFSGVTHVFIFQLSDDTDAYVHRSGRTGRVDRHGVVTTFVTNRELRALKKVIHRVQCKPVWIGPEPDLDSKPSSPSKGKPKRYTRRSPRNNSRTSDKSRNNRQNDAKS